jgi:hypothetical protein
MTPDELDILYQLIARVLCPRIYSTDLDDLPCKIMAETDLMHEPPDQRAAGEAPEDQDDGGPYPTLRALLVSRDGRLSVFFEYERRNQLDGQPNPQRHDDQVVQVAEDGNKIRESVQLKIDKKMA